MRERGGDIISFQDERGGHLFLSNFYPSPIIGRSVMVYPTVEHYFQAQKQVDEGYRARVAGAATPRIAKQIGRSATLREGWERIKLDVMRRALALKFPERESELGALLVDTGRVQLVEGNTWQDRYWGVDVRTGRGENWLGVLLMERRSLLQVVHEGE